MNVEAICDGFDRDIGCGVTALFCSPFEYQALRKYAEARNGGLGYSGPSCVLWYRRCRVESGDFQI